MEIRDLELVNCINQTALKELDTALQAWGFRVFTLHGDNITDKATFLAQVEKDLPLSAGLQPHNWDALVDCLWGGLKELADPHVAIVWTHAQRLLDSDLQDFLIAVDSLTDVGRDVYSGVGFAHEMSLYIFVVGEGSNFRPLPPATA